MDSNENCQVQQIEDCIKYQIEKMNYLCNARKNKTQQLINEIANNLDIDKDNELGNQVLTDAILNSMASLIDYYYMYCFIKMGLKSDNLTKVQYRPMTNNYIQFTSSYTKQEQSRPTLQDITERFNKKITDCSGIQVPKINVHDYWFSFFGEAISASLHEVGLLPTRNFVLEYTPDGFKINNLIKKYHTYTQSFYCNERLHYGCKYNIYLDINNCLKHNIVPYTETTFETIDGITLGFLYFKFKTQDNVFLKKGLLQNIVDLDFDELSEMLKKRSRDETCEHQDPVIRWLLDKLLTIDKSNGYVSKDGNKLLFFVDEVLIAKSKDATYVDALGSLIKTLTHLIKDINWGMGLDMSEFDCETAI